MVAMAMVTASALEGARGSGPARNGRSAEWISWGESSVAEACLAPEIQVGVACVAACLRWPISLSEPP